MLNGTMNWGPSVGSPMMNGNSWGPVGMGNSNPYQSLAAIFMLFALFEGMQQQQQQGGQCFPQGSWSDPCGCNSAMNFDPCCMPSGCLPDMSCWQPPQDDCGCHPHPDHCEPQPEHCEPQPQPQASAAAAVAVQQEQQPQPQQFSGGDGGDGGGGDGGGDGGGTPVILDLNGDGKLDTTGKGGAKINFDLDGDGKQDNVEWMKKGSQDGLLVADFNGDGKINDGSELMRRTGENGEQNKYKNGWDKVSTLFDKNHDGVVNGAELNGLQMWVDSNGDGKTDPGELKSLAQLGISSIDLPKNQGEMDSTFVRNGRTQLARDYDFEMANGGRVA